MAINYPQRYDDDFINTIKELIDHVNEYGKTIQDLVAEGQLTEEQYAELLTTINGLVKSGEVDKSDLSPEFKGEIEDFDTQLAQTETKVRDIENVISLHKNIKFFDKMPTTAELLENEVGLVLGDIVDKKLYYGFSDENPIVTGGWLKRYTNGQGTMYKEGFLFVKSGTDDLIVPTTGYATNFKVDLTDVNTVYVDWEGTRTAGSANVGVHPTKEESAGSSIVYTARVAQIGAQTWERQVQSFDVSTLTGEYYFKAWSVGNTGEFKVYRIWGE